MNHRCKAMDTGGSTVTLTNLHSHPFPRRFSEASKGSNQSACRRRFLFSGGLWPSNLQDRCTLVKSVSFGSALWFFSKGFAS